MYFAVKKYFPLELKDVFGGEKIKPEKVMRASGRLGILSFNGAFLKLSFYESFLVISYFGRCMVIKYSEKIEIERKFYFLYSINNIKFPNVNSEITFYVDSNSDAEYIRSRFGNQV